MARRSLHYQISEWMRDRLASIRGGTEAGTGFAFTPDVVEIVGGFPQAPIADYFPDTIGGTSCSIRLIDSGSEQETQKTSGDLDYEAVFYVLAGHKFTPPIENPFSGWESIVDPAPFANGALTIARQPTAPTRLRVQDPGR
jgi:hypothetical protein